MTDETPDLTPPTPERDVTPEPTAETTSDERTARFARRQAELDAMSDEDLKARFWELSHQMMEPVVELARTHTSPSIERSILLRMGIDSVSSHGVVDKIHDKGLLGKGAGHVVLKVSHKLGCDVRAAATAITDDDSVLDGLFDTTTAQAK
ncbi:D-ornithine 4,5-aminomutase subunit OraS [Arsenicicoccus dermatophilus]|uniref:D-ornithine 4,5-aminomutase subunit OraS n=1 Tax=Arsenicicoccus dermatophilus TaxID=1076331 RepID=UPI001F4CE0DA|nr:D-ornithine 4,5-aminomutase subunit OraS [Arsenicicoccus dermatophilus]MCH8613728.1 ornithine aminomutase subunit alpha [Arsenicicoccus dermatophilus]